ncbi:MAG: ester cyclase [Anaerolineae bacterium]|nr:ester cyclase [Anaerolineae bacterium]MDW8173727.1 ester cyclase [Anaerolineae bacterium]
MAKSIQSENSPQTISLQDKIDLRFMVDAQGQRRHAMEGFDPKFADFVEYILKITHEIWEEKAIGKLYDYYANTVQIHTSDGTIHGREAVMAATIATLAAYPDRRLYGDEVIWSGDDVKGFYSSHRLTHTGTNRGWSLYGPPTGRKISYRAIADCFCKRNMVIEEWLVRDELTLVRQLRLDPIATAKEHARRAAESAAQTPVIGDVERGIGQLPPSIISASETFEPENFIRRALHEIWNWRLLNTVRHYFAETIHLESASMRRLSGHNDYQAYVLSLLAPFPDLALTVEHFCALGDDASGYRTATRWRMRGTHTGYGIYGEPTGQRINILGVSHHLIQDGKIQQEWTLFDEFALLKQLHRPV